MLPFVLFTFINIPFDPSYDERENPPPLKLEVVEFPEFDLRRAGRARSSKILAERDIGGRKLESREDDLSRLFGDSAMD